MLSCTKDLSVHSLMVPLENRESSTRIKQPQSVDIMKVTVVNEKSAVSIGGVPLKRRLGFFSGVSLIVGTIIGAGIFVSPKGVFQNTGSVGLCLVVWCACGVISMGAALVYAELGLLLPKSGSCFGYYLAAFGTFPAFMYSWTQMIINPAGQVVKALTVAEYLSKAIFDQCGENILTKKIVAALVLLTVSITNCISVRLVMRTQIVFTAFKLVGLVAIILGGIITLVQGNNGILTSGFDESVTNPTNIVSAIYGGLFAFNGWAMLNVVVEEVQNPRRNLPLCIITSVLLVLVVYILVNISYFTVLSKAEYLSSWAVAATWAQYVVTSAAIVVPITVALSIYGSMNGVLMVVARIMFATAREGLFPEVLSYLDINTNIPLPSTVLSIFLSFVMILPSDIQFLLNMLGFLNWFFYGLSMLAHLILRYKMKDVDRPFRVPIVIPIMLLALCAYLVIAPFLVPVKTEFWYAIIILAAGVIMYFLFVFFRLSLPGMDKIERFTQLLMRVAPPEEFKM